MSYQSADTVHHRDGNKVILFDGLRHFVDGSVYVYGDRVFLHHVFHFGDRRGGDHLLEREDSPQAFIVVNDIYIIYFVQFFGLLAHFLQTLGHTPVLVHDYHFGAHQTTGGVFVIFQEVHDVSCLFDVFDVRKNFFLLVFVEVTHQVYGIIRVHVVHKALGDCFRRDHFEELFTNVLIHFDKYVGRSFIVEQAVDKPGFFRVQVITQSSDVGGVKVDKKFFYLIGIFLLDKVFYVVNVFLVHLFVCD